MKKHETIKRTIEKEEYKLTEICCNKCGAKTKIHYDEEGYEADFSINEYQSFSTSFGYGSRFDMQNWQFDLCEECLIELAKSFKFSPSGFGCSGYMPHNEQLTFEVWKETGEIDLEVGITPEEIEAQGGSIYMEEDED